MASVLLDSGQALTFSHRRALEKPNQLLPPTEATIELANGQKSKILGTATVNLRLSGFRMHVFCFVTNMGTNFDITLGNTFVTDQKLC